MPLNRGVLVAVVLLSLRCGLDGSQKDRCATNGDCNAGRICAAGVCENSGAPTIGCGNHDFNDDGHRDILWFDYTTAATQIWYMNGVSHVGSAALDSAPAQADSGGWRMAGVGDFNHDGHPDIVMRNGASGVTEIWYTDGVSRTGVEDFDPSLNLTDDTGWSVASVCDFDHDGWPDILWHNGEYGPMQLWYMRGTARAGYANLDGTSVVVADTSGWQVAGTGDFNRDSKPDILWRGTSDNQAMVWLMDGFTLSSTDTVGSMPNMPQTMTLSETDDLDSDGSSDLVWWDSTTGTVEIWLMNGTVPTTTVDLAGAPIGDEWALVTR